MLGEISKLFKNIVGKNELQKKKIQLNGKQKIVKYDGEFHEVKGFVTEVYNINNKEYHIKYDTYIAKGKDAGIYYSEIRGKVSIFNSKGKDVTEQFEIEIVPGKLIIEKRNVILKSASGVHEYDGKQFELNSIEIYGDGFLDDEEINCNCQGKIHLPGEVTNTINYSLSQTVNPHNYDIVIQEGTLKIIDRTKPYEIELSFPDIVQEYSGEEVLIQRPQEYAIKIDGINYRIQGLNVFVKGRNVGVYEYTVKGIPHVYNEYDEEVTKQFLTKFKYGKLEIVPKKLMLTSASACKRYDGEPLIDNDVVVDGLVDENALHIEISGAQTDIGRSQNTFDYFFEPLELEKNYIVEKKYGELEVELQPFDKNKEEIPKIEYILGNEEYRKATLKEVYCINTLEYENTLVNELDLSTRILHCLQGRMHINKVSEMLELSYEQLAELKGFGKTSITGLDNLLRGMTSLKNSLKENKTKMILRSKTKQFLRGHLSEICNKKFEFCKEWEFNDDEQTILKKIIEATELLDQKLIIDILENPDHSIPILNMMNTLVAQYNEKRKVHQQISSVYKQISKEKMDCNIKWFVYAYIDDDYKRKDMLELCKNLGIFTVRDFIKVDFKDDSNLASIIRFVKWCGFDIKKDVELMYEKLYKNEREQEIISNRSQGNTLDTTGKVFGVTRERIRQIEKKVIRRFGVLLDSNRIILKIFAERDGDEILTPAELSEYFDEKTEQILYLLRRTESSFYTYDSDLDVFVVGSSGLAERAQTYVDKLPEVFTEDKFDEIVRCGIEEYNLTEEIILAHIGTEYKKTEKLYHRSRLTLQSIYDAILKKYYSEGIWVYGKKDIEEFRMHIQNDYGNIILPENDRALVSQVCRAAILCGRGIYKAKQKKYMSGTLLKKIEKYIDTNESSVFMMNTIFNIFEDELRAENINNKYYLQGILHEEFGNKWCFRRDYISKDEKVTSIYTEIVTYIKKAGYPVKKQEIQKKYPGITEIVLNIATNDSKILNLFGSYIHGDNLRLSKEDILYLRSVIELFLEKKDSWHCRSIYEYVMKDNPIILKRNYINIPFGIYSLLEYCFSEEYNFSRPYIAKNGVEIASTLEMLQEVVQASDVMEISDISAYARKNYHQINNILGFLDTCNETHFLINNSEIASIDIIGITETDIDNIEKTLEKEVKDVMAINNLKCVHMFPKVNFPWTEWLIYSGIKRWGKKYEVKPSESQLKQAIALIAPKGKMVVEKAENLSENSELVIADDLSNIDDLIENFALEELEFDEL